MSRRGRRLAFAVAVTLTAVCVAHLLQSGNDHDRATSDRGDSSPVAPIVVHQTPATPQSPSQEWWPSQGQAAYEIAGTVHVSPVQEPVPIASLAKLMTALLVAKHPITGLTVDQHDIDDTAARARRGESVVPLALGERLTQTQALEALLLPSANNVASMLATAFSGSQAAFVKEMNAEARALHMTRTTYTDPSGYDNATTSTAQDQLRLVEAFLQVPELARIVALPTAVLPVAGTVRNTDTLVGSNGWVGVKTGSTDAAGGCFAFRAVRAQQITGVVLGQRGGPLIMAGLQAAQLLVDSVSR